MQHNDETSSTPSIAPLSNSVQEVAKTTRRLLFGFEPKTSAPAAPSSPLDRSLTPEFMSSSLGNSESSLNQSGILEPMGSAPLPPLSNSTPLNTPREEAPLPPTTPQDTSSLSQSAPQRLFKLTPSAILQETKPPQSGSQLSSSAPATISSGPRDLPELSNLTP